MLSAAVSAAVVAVIGLLTVRGRPLWSPDRDWSRDLFDAGLRHPVLADVAEVVGDVTVPRGATVRLDVTSADGEVRGLQGEQQADWLWKVELEIDNVRSAIAFALGPPTTPARSSRSTHSSVVAVVVMASISRSSSSMRRVRTRVTSAATLPLPITAAWVPPSGGSRSWRCRRGTATPG